MRKSSENRTTIDALTGCLTFYAFKSSVAQILSEFDSTKKYALLYIDIKDFKFFNDMLGYQGGDEILQYISSLLMNGIDGTDVVARISGDIFVTFRQFKDFDEILMRHSYFVHQLRNYVTPAMMPLRIESFCGIYLVESKQDVLTVAEMLDRANLAQRTLRDKPGENLALYDSAMREEYLWQREVESRMYNALAAHEFEVYFQPQIDIQDRNILAGAEALIRWHYPGKGIILPDSFIPIFEKNGFIIHLDEYVMRKVCEMQADFLCQGKHLFPIAVNVSQYDLFHPEFLQRYVAIKNEYKIPDFLIELEFTETVMFNNHELFKAIMHNVKSSGFLCALDDFGSGNSSLTILKNLPVDVLKIDKQFFVPSGEPEKDNAIIFSVIAMARALNMRTISEGIEDASILKFLRKIGCNYVQGFVFSRPLPWSKFRQLVIETDASFMEPLALINSQNSATYDSEYISAKYRFVSDFFDGIIMDIDFEQNRYVVEHSAGVGRFASGLPVSGLYSDFLTHFLVPNSDLNDAEHIKSVMNLDNIKNVFFHNEEQIFVDFSYSVDNAVHRFRMTVMRIVLEDYQRFAGIAFIQDITMHQHKSPQEHLLEQEQNLLSVFMEALHWNTYIINSETYEILYSNSALRSWFPAMKPGAVCYNAFGGRLSPCPKCPLSVLRHANQYPFHDSKMEVEIDGKCIECSVNNIKLNECRTAVLLSFDAEKLKT